MGILGTAINQLTGQLFNFGFDQLDDFVTRKIQEGRDEEAFAALDQWEEDALRNIQLSQTNQPFLFGGQQVDPATVQGQGILQGQFGIPQVPSAIAKSPLAGQAFTQILPKVLANDPFFAEQERQRAIQEAITGARQTAFGGLARQRDIGTGAIGPGIRGEIDFTAPQLQESQARGAGLKTAFQETAKEPSRQRRFQERMQLKQTPGARARGGGGSKDDSTTIFSSVTDSDISRITSMLKTSPEYYDVNAKQLTERGLNVLNNVGEIIPGQKKKNLIKARQEAVKREKEQFEQTRQEERARFGTPPGINRLGVSGTATVPRFQQETPTEALESVQPSIGRGTQTQESQSTLTDLQINALERQARNLSPQQKQEMREKLVQRGIDPSVIPSLRQ